MNEDLKTNLIKKLKQIDQDNADLDKDPPFDEYIVKRANKKPFIQLIHYAEDISISIIDGKDIEEREDFTFEVKVWVILKVSNNEEITYWKLPGEFSSYGGNQWYFKKLTQVEIKETVINTYEPI